MCNSNNISTVANQEAIQGQAYLMQASSNRDTHVDDLDPGSLLGSILLNAAKPEVLVPPSQPLMQLMHHMHQQILFLWVEGHHIWPCHLHQVRKLSLVGLQQACIPKLTALQCVSVNTSLGETVILSMHDGGIARGLSPMYSPSFVSLC